jgi:aspartokinase
MLEEMSKANRYFLILSQGVFETTIILSRELETQIKTISHGEKIVAVIKNLASITIRLPEEAITTAGVHYYINKALAWENINVVEVASTYSEFTVILKENDVDKAFSILKRSLA